MFRRQNNEEASSLWTHSKNTGNRAYTVYGSNICLLNLSTTVTTSFSGDARP